MAVLGSTTDYVMVLGLASCCRNPCAILGWRDKDWWSFHSSSEEPAASIWFWMDYRLCALADLRTQNTLQGGKASSCQSRSPTVGKSDWTGFSELCYSWPSLAFFRSDTTRTFWKAIGSFGSFWPAWRQWPWTRPWQFASWRGHMAPFNQRRFRTRQKARTMVEQQDHGNLHSGKFCTPISAIAES